MPRYVWKRYLVSPFFVMYFFIIKCPFFSIACPHSWKGVEFMINYSCIFLSSFPLLAWWKVEPSHSKFCDFECEVFLFELFPKWKQLGAPQILIRKEKVNNRELLTFSINPIMWAKGKPCFCITIVSLLFQKVNAFYKNRFKKFFYSKFGLIKCRRVLWIFLDN